MLKGVVVRLSVPIRAMIPAIVSAITASDPVCRDCAEERPGDVPAGDTANQRAKRRPKTFAKTSAAAATRRGILSRAPHAAAIGMIGNSAAPMAGPIKSPNGMKNRMFAIKSPRHGIRAQPSSSVRIGPIPSAGWRNAKG